MRNLVIFVVFLMVQISCFAKEPVEILMKTSYGDIQLELYPDVAPKTVKNFVRLTKQDFFDGLYFHRVIPEFMIQTGDPNTRDDDRNNDGMGDPGYSFSDEINANALKLDTLKIENSMLQHQFPPNHAARKMTVKQYYEKMKYTYRDDLPSISNEYGYISMANSGPNTNGSQFFIITRKDGATWLDGKHTVFGKVIEGMDVIHKIENLPRDERDNPLLEHQAKIIEMSMH